MAATEQRPITGLEAEFRYYLEHQDELVAEHNGKYLVIKGATVFGAYDTVADAYLAASKEHEPGTFLIQRCSPGDEDYTNTYHSRVCFAS